MSYYYLDLINSIILSHSIVVFIERWYRVVQLPCILMHQAAPICVFPLNHFSARLLVYFSLLDNILIDLASLILL